MLYYKGMVEYKIKIINIYIYKNTFRIADMVTGQAAVVNNRCITQAMIGINVHLLITAQTNNVKQ